MVEVSYTRALHAVTEPCPIDVAINNATIGTQLSRRSSEQATQNDFRMLARYEPCHIYDVKTFSAKNPGATATRSSLLGAIFAIFIWLRISNYALKVLFG